MLYIFSIKLNQTEIMAKSNIFFFLLNVNKINRKFKLQIIFALNIYGFMHVVVAVKIIIIITATTT